MIRREIVLSNPVRTAIGTFDAGARGLENRRYRTDRNQRSLCGDRHCGDARAWASGRHCQRRRRRLAHGHPIGATGAIYSMQRDGIKRGVVTLCIGGGQGIVLALESVR